MPATIVISNLNQISNPVSYEGVDVRVMPNLGNVVIWGNIKKHPVTHDGGNLWICSEGNTYSSGGHSIVVEGDFDIKPCSQGGGGEA